MSVQPLTVAVPVNVYVPAGRLLNVGLLEDPVCVNVTGLPVVVFTAVQE